MIFSADLFYVNIKTIDDKNVGMVVVDYLNIYKMMIKIIDFLILQI
jgi:hypothetical protein